MKAKKLLIGCLLLLPAWGHGQINLSWQPDRTQELGRIDESKGIQERRFIAANTGDYSWQVVRGYTSCGCTKIEFTQEQIVRPGDTAQFLVRFDPAGKVGLFREVATVQLTDGETTINESLILTGEVLRSAESLKRQFPLGQGAIRANTGSVDFGEVNRNKVAERHIVICNADSIRHKVQWRTSNQLIQNDGISNLELLPGETYDIVLRWDGKAEQRWGLTHEQLFITGPDEQMRIDLAAVLLPEVKASATAPALKTERRVKLEAATPSAKKTIQRLSVQNIGASDLHIFRVYSEQEGIVVKGVFPMAIGPGKSSSIELEILPLWTPEIPITIISDDARKPRQTIRLVK